MYDCLMLALAITLLFWVPVIVVLTRRGFLNPKSSKVISKAEPAGRYTVASLVDLPDSTYKLRYEYVVDGCKYRYLMPIKAMKVPQSLTVYWEFGKPGKAYTKECVVNGAVANLFCALPFICWLGVYWALCFAFPLV